MLMTVHRWCKLQDLTFGFGGIAHAHKVHRINVDHLDHYKYIPAIVFFSLCTGKSA